LRSAIAIYPKYLSAHNDLGTLLLSQGKLEQAREEFRMAIDLDPKAYNPHLNLGIVLVQQQKFREAASVLKTACSLNASAPSARLYFGIALVALDEPAAEGELKAAHDLGELLMHWRCFILVNSISITVGARMHWKFFQRYLHESPNGSNSAEAERLVEILR